MIIPLLPRQDDPEKDWKAEKEDFFQLNVADIRERLGPEKHLAPEGVASALAQLRFVNWILEDQKSVRGREAAQVLRLVVLLQYLRYLEGQKIFLDPSRELGWLASVLEKCWGEGPKSLILWNIRGFGAKWDGLVFAASLPENPFVPGAMFYPDESPSETSRLSAWRQVRDTLVAVRGPRGMVNLENDQIRVVHPHLAASLSEYLDSFISAGPPKAPWVIALKAWKDELKEDTKGGQAQRAAVSEVSVSIWSSAGKTIPVDFAFYPDVLPDEAWICEKCEGARTFWGNFEDTQTITGNNPGVSCKEHGTQLRTRHNEPVGPQQYGAYRAPDGTLFVWTDEKARPAGGEFVEMQGSLGSDGEVVYRFNRQKLVIKGKLVSLDTVRASPVAWMLRDERGKPVPVDVPVKGEYAVLVKTCKRDDIKRAWEIEFNGQRGVVKIPYPERRETLWGRSVIVIWPRMECEKWLVEYVAASTGGAAVGYRLIEEIGEGKDRTLLPPSFLCSTHALYRTKNGRLRYIEVGEIEQQDSFKSMGLLDARRDRVEVDGPGTEGVVVLDFGTSSSAVLWEVPGASEPGFVLSGEEPNEPAKFLTFTESDFNNLPRAVCILSPMNRNEKPARRFLPSFLAKADPMKKGSESSIPPWGQGLHLLAGGEPRVISGLKWKDWSAPGIQERVESFIETLLLPALWKLCGSGCKSAKLIATYPLAFGETKKGSYKKILKTITDRLSKQTGLQVSLEPEPLLISESAAASRKLSQTNVTHVVTVDVGGGTTDLAIHVGEAGKALVGQELNTVLAADSIEYAGRDFLRAVVVAYGIEFLYKIFPGVDQNLQPPAPGEFEDADMAVEAYVASLEALLHRHGVEGLERLLKYVPAGSKSADRDAKFKETIMRWEALFAGLLFYVSRMVEASIKLSIPDVSKHNMLSVKLNLFGQGWELFRILGQVKQPVRTLVEERFGFFSEKIGRALGANVTISVDALPQNEERKTIVVKGANEIQKHMKPGAEVVEGLASSYPLADDIRKTFVGMDVYDAQGKVVVRANERLEELPSKPSLSGDPGYGHLLDELFDAIPEFMPGTKQQLRAQIKGLLLNSTAFQREFSTKDVRKVLIDGGQDDLNRETWPSGNRSPARSLLAGFLTSVWRSRWSSTKL